MKSVYIRTFSGSAFPTCGLNTKVYFVNLCFQSECGENKDQKNSKYEHFLQCG